MARDQPALAGVKVVDATSTAAGQFCGRLFADYGAEVILVEGPDGAATRGEGPFDDTGSLLFRHLNQGKAGFTWRHDAASDLDLNRLLREADIVLDGCHDAALPGEILDGDDTVLTFSLPADGARHWLRADVRSADGERTLMIGNPIYLNG